MLIDVHGHLGRIDQRRSECVDVTNLIAKMDKWGIDRCCVLPLSEHPEGAYLEGTTQDILRECARYRDRLIPFCLIDPRHGNDPNYDFSPLLEEYRTAGCVGMGEMLPSLDIDDPRALNLYRQAGQFGMPVLFDMMVKPTSYGLRDEFGLPKLEHTLRVCPETVFIGHGPTFWAEISGEIPEEERGGYPTGPIAPGGAVPRLMRQYDNLWADISAGSGYNALTRDPAFGIEFLDEFQDKLLFGTDSCLRSDVNLIYITVQFWRDVCDNRKISVEAQEKIAWRNAVRLLGI